MAKNAKNSDTKLKKMKNELSPKQLRWTCPESKFRFKTTKDIKPLEAIVGQPRAIEAIRLGAELFAKGYNIFVTGLSGTGRFTTVKKILEEVTTYHPQLYDYCYVKNFENPDTPRLIKLPSGKGKQFSKSMEDAITYLRRRLPKLFEEDTFQIARRKIVEEYQDKEKEILHAFDEKIKPFGFIRGQIENDQGVTQPEVFPLIDDQPVQVDLLDDFITEGKLTREKADEIKELYKKFHNEIYDLARKGMKLMQNFRKDLAENDKKASEILVSTTFDEIRDAYANEKMNIYIEEVKKFVLENLSIFVPSNNTLNQVLESQQNNSNEKDKYQDFLVNVILDNSNTENAPIVVETSPSYTNLFGTIERTFDNRGFWKTDFTKIKAGALLAADQGYLIVNALDLFTEAGVWPTLKRVLLYDKLEIQPYEAIFQLSQLHLKPEPIEVSVKVIIIGGQSLYQMLYLYEKGFKKIFKVNAQFDYETEKTEEMIKNYAHFISRVCEAENLPHCTPDGVAAIIEWGVEHAGSQKRISLKFSDVSDIIRESAFYDRGSRRKYINREDVEKAIEWRRHRNDLIDEKIKGHILEGTIMIDTEGERVGQINGLTVLDTGIYSFGKPARITATVSSGNAGVVNIEREVDLSGKIHNKGVLIITSILRERFAHKLPLSFSASLAFEQSYGGVDGDSASAAEIYAILSSITGIPIKQKFAVTGSVNQKGDIQPIGGVNQKIIGFYEICRDKGFTGDQGVLIPIQNVNDLMLPAYIIESVKEGKFHIFTMSVIEDGIELLLGKPAGVKRKDGVYPPDSVYGLVDKRLEELRKAAKAFMSKKEKE